MKTLYSIIALLLYSSICIGETFSYNDKIKLDVNGYLGYKYIISSEQNTTIQSEPELGLALSLQLHDYLSLYTQFKYDENIDNALVYSFASFDYPINEDLSISIKGGKLRNSYGLYNDLRVNPRTRGQVIIPQAIYWNSLGTVLTSGIGVRFDIKWKNFEVSYSIAEPVITDSVQDAKVWAGALLDKTDTKFGDSQIGYIKYSSSDIPLTLKTSISRFNFGNKTSSLSNALFPQFANKDTIFYLFTNSVEYSWRDFTFIGEHLLVKGSLYDWNKIGQWSNGYSVTGKYELTDHITTYINYNQYNSQLPGITNYPQSLATTGDLNGGFNYHQDAWQIGVEAHRIQGARWMYSNDYRSDPNGFDTWWMVGINAVYFF